MILQKTEQETDHMTPVAAHLNQLEDDLHMVFGYLSERLVQFMNCSCPTWTRGVFSPLLQSLYEVAKTRRTTHQSPAETEFGHCSSSTNTAC